MTPLEQAQQWSSEFNEIPYYPNVRPYVRSLEEENNRLRGELSKWDNRSRAVEWWLGISLIALFILGVLYMQARVELDREVQLNSSYMESVEINAERVCTMLYNTSPIYNIGQCTRSIVVGEGV